MKPITAKITLTEPEWYLLYLCFWQASGVLPNGCANGMKLHILSRIEEGLLTAISKESLKKREKTGDL